MDKKEVIDKIRKYKSLLNKKFDVKKVFLFGSYARGTNREDSDIDVAIVVEKFDGDYFETIPLLWKLRREIDDRIEPVLIEKRNDKSGFLKEIEKYGIEIN
ncbi:MAG: nucleotidyltransferase domain-containing protein [Chlorobi bacterium]|nr:nucleotidyltransferase domain-containing protein [Chlorobiota bacterium]